MKKQGSKKAAAVKPSKAPAATRKAAPKAKRKKGGRVSGSTSLARVRRLDLIEGWWLGDPDPTLQRLVEYLREPVPLPGCQQCRLSSGKRLGLHDTVPSCEHGPPRASGDGGRPISIHAVRKDSYVVRDRIQARAHVHRGKNWELTLRRFDEIFKRALRTGDWREALAAAARRADLDGSRQAAEEAQQPTLGDQALGLCARFVDWTATKPERTNYSPAELEIIYARGIRLAHRATDAVHKGRALAPPPPSEIDRRLWVQARVAEQLGIVLASPGVTPAERREALVRLAGVYALGSSAAAVADRVTALEQLLAQVMDGGSLPSK